MPVKSENKSEVNNDAVVSEILQRLRSTLAPVKLSIENLTEAHKKHKKAHGDTGGHYVISIVSELFQGLNRTQRERWVSSLLGDMMPKKIHALSLKLKSPDEEPGSLV